MRLYSIEPSGEPLGRFCALAGAGSLSPESVQRHAPDDSLLLEQDGTARARCSLWWRAVPPLPGERIGIVGHYAAAGIEAATRLLDAACERLRASGCTLAVGPMDGSTWRRYRLLTWRGTEPAFFLEPDNPDDWALHFTRSAFTPFAEYFSAKCDDLEAYPADARLDARMHEAGYRARPIDMSRIEAELSLLWRLAVEAFSGNFLYTAITEAEFKEMYAPLLPVVRPELVNIVEHHGVPVGFVFGVPDMLQAARNVALDTVILKTMGVLPAQQGRGLGNWMTDFTFVTARELGFRKGIFALMHEANVSRRLGRGLARDIRRYTLFARRFV
jgi:GNAT superfamily N-acetyltransferase